jgi:hypothetical protein
MSQLANCPPQRNASLAAANLPPGGERMTVNTIAKKQTMLENSRCCWPLGAKCSMPDDVLLAIVEVNGGAVRAARYLRRPLQCAPDFGVTSVNSTG